MTQIKRSKREKDEFTGGWSQTVTVDGRTLRVVLERGRYIGKHYGKRCFVWNGFVYENGRCIHSVDANKGTSLTAIIEGVVKL